MWERYKKYLFYSKALGLKLDISRMNFREDYLAKMKGKIQTAFQAMEQLEQGNRSNLDEKRMVGHYWLRNPELAPGEDLTQDIKQAIEKIKIFAENIHNGKIVSPLGRKFRNFILIGIGGSALGPQFMANALGTLKDPIKPYFIDNTDPEGMDRVLQELDTQLAETLVIVISKSGGTKETRNGMLEVKHQYELKGLDFAKHTVAVTQKNSQLDQIAQENGWLEVFPIWDWVGGRTSVTSAVGLLPAALQGIDIDLFLKGARTCDEITRRKKISRNPAALLALMWYHATKGQGGKNMVILPYKDRLQLFTKYLQQLIMESLGKGKDVAGNNVQQGITVLGNKGSTDQHSYVQQLLDGPENLFVTFIEVLKDGRRESIFVEESITSGDYLSSFLQGTRHALTQRGRESITLTIETINAHSIGALIALYERTVGYYATLVNINAYHQPAVEAGKKGARLTLDLQVKVLQFLQQNKEKSYSLKEIAHGIGQDEEIETIFHILEHARWNNDHRIARIK